MSLIPTKKFSEFIAGSLNNTNQYVGLSGGANAKFDGVNNWTTATRPTTPTNGLLGYNTTLGQYEFYDNVTAMWTQLEDSTDIAALLALLASHATGEGASLIGLEAQGVVTTETVQDLAEAKFIVQQNNNSMVNAQALGDLVTGILASTTVTGVVVSRTLTGTANEVDIANGDGSGNPTFSLSATLDAPGTFTIQGTVALDAIIDDDTFATATATNIPTAESVKTYVDSLTAAIGAAGTIQRSNGSAWIASTATFADTYAASTILYSNGANTVTGLATANSAMLSTDASGVPSWSASATDGQLLIGSTGAQPALATITPGTGISVANSAGGITISATGGGFAVATISGTSQAAAVNTMYIALNAGQTTLTLPATFSVGDTISLVGSNANAGGWIIQMAAGDVAMYIGTATSGGGTLTSAAAAGQTIELVADVADTSWVVVDAAVITLTTA